MNFIYGLLSGLMIAVISLRSDMAVLVSYLLHYFFLGKILNRPKYISDLGKFIIFQNIYQIWVNLLYSLFQHR